MVAVLDADPRLITEEKINSLKGYVDYVCISIDHHEEDGEYQSRKISGLHSLMSIAIARLHEAHIPVDASIVICNLNYATLPQLFDKCLELGFDYISINYPEESLSEIYDLGGINLSKEEVVEALRVCIRSKESGLPIINPVEPMSNIIDYLNGAPVKYKCLGGNKVLFVDWFLDVYPCMHSDKKICSVVDLSRKLLVTKECNKCSMSWYRDFSVYLNGVKSVPPMVRLIAKQFR